MSSAPPDLAAEQPGPVDPGADRPVAVVGGGARGIGAALVARLRARGHHVDVLDAVGGSTLGYPHADAEDQAAVEATGARVHTVDLREPGETRAAVDQIASARGRVDVVVSCAATVAGGRPLWETSTEVREGLVAAAAWSAWNLAAAATPHLVQRPAADRPSLVVVTSVAGRRGLYGLSGYVVAKHAAVGVVRALAADLVGTSVTACGVSPGATDSPMLGATARLYGLPEVGTLAAGQHPPRPITADEVAAVVEHACLAGPVVHGSIIDASGGSGHV